MKYGYARVSTRGQKSNGNSLDDQRAKLLAEGCEEIVVEQYSGAKVARPLFSELIKKLDKGDTLVVAKLDRLARNVREGSKTIQELLDRGVKVHVLNIGLLENSTIGRFIVNTLLAVAELEREMIMERVQAGKEIAKHRPGYRDGRPRISSKQTNHALQLIESGLSYTKVSELTGISRSTLLRRMRERRLVLGPEE